LLPVVTISVYFKRTNIISCFLFLIAPKQLLSRIKKALRRNHFLPGDPAADQQQQQQQQQHQDQLNKLLAAQLQQQKKDIKDNKNSSNDIIANTNGKEQIDARKKLLLDKNTTKDDIVRQLGTGLEAS
jgi:hypothetical protein